MTEFQILTKNKGIKISHSLENRTLSRTLALSPSQHTSSLSLPLSTRTLSVVICLSLSTHLGVTSYHLHRQVSFAFYSSQSFLPLTDRFLSRSLISVFFFSQVYVCVKKKVSKILKNVKIIIDQKRSNKWWAFYFRGKEITFILNCKLIELR